MPKQANPEDKWEVFYFGLYAKGEFPRVALELVGANWENKVIEFSDWPNFKPTTPGGFLPCVSKNGGDYMDQTKAVTRFIIESHGYACTTPKEQYMSEQLIDTIMGDCKAYTPEGM